MTTYEGKLAKEFLVIKISKTNSFRVMVIFQNVAEMSSLKVFSMRRLRNYKVRKTVFVT